MNIQQIANTIDERNWLFTVIQTEPTHKHLVKSRKSNQGTAEYIEKLIKENKSEEVQIIPVAVNGTSKTPGAGKVITLKINNNKSKQMVNNTNGLDLNALAGLNGLGLSMADIFTAKDKGAENKALNTKVEELKEKIDTLKSENTKLENKIYLNEIKATQKNEWLDIVKSPQVMSLATALISKGVAPTPALGTPTPQQTQELDEKIKWLVNFLEQEGTPEMAKDMMIYIAKAHQDENAAMILKDIVATLQKHNLIQTTKNEA